MANSKRLSQSMTESWKDAFAPTHISPSADDVEQWLAAWKAVFVRGIHYSNDPAYPLFERRHRSH